MCWPEGRAGGGTDRQMGGELGFQRIWDRPRRSLLTSMSVAARPACSIGRGLSALQKFRDLFSTQDAQPAQGIVFVGEIPGRALRCGETVPAVGNDTVHRRAAQDRKGRDGGRFAEESDGVAADRLDADDLQQYRGALSARQSQIPLPDKSSVLCGNPE